MNEGALRTEADATSPKHQEGRVHDLLDEDRVTPVELRAGIWLKRDDLFLRAGVRGGKVRTCWSLARGAPGLVTAGARASPQVNIVAHIARELLVPCRVHVPSGELKPELVAARDAGAEVVQHRYGRNTVLVARAREDAAARGWREIPFGMECREAVEQTRRQVENLPVEARRIVVPVGSGMSLAGVLWGLGDRGLRVPVLGVVVGADPRRRLSRFAPPRGTELLELVPAAERYEDEAAGATEIGGVLLDPIYEAKALRFLRPGDLLWIVGLRQTADPTRRLSRLRSETGS